MKIILAFSVCLALLQISCNPVKKNLQPSACYTGRLEVKGACMNYTISVVNGDASGFATSSWKNEETGKTYKNAFALGSKCDFPATINEGDEFTFVLDSTARQDCAVCMMYYPTPPTKVSIRVIPGPCK